MLLRVAARSLQTRASWPRQTRFLSATSSSSSSSSAAAEPAAAAQTPLERQRERRRKERAEPAPTTIGIEGTTEFYTRQLVVVDPDESAPVSWPKKIEFSDHVVAAYVQALVANGESPKFSPLKTIAATPFPAPCPGGLVQDDVDMATRKHDLLVFPDGLRVQDVEVSKIPALVAQLVQPNPNVPAILHDLELQYKPLAPGHHILVCAHESRDERCGCNGPKLLRWLQEVGAQQNVPLHLYSSSHFGGHRYAPNCIAYPSGDWFGLLNAPSDAAALVAALEDKQPLRLHTQWRGRIAMTKDQQLQTLKHAVDATAAAAAETSA